VRQWGGVDLPTIQRYINFHFSVSLDLFGQELSTNAANYYSMGLKGRFQETRITDDHVLTDAVYQVPELKGDEVAMVDASALTAVNERLRDDYVADCQRGIDKWNRIIEKAGIDFKLQLPSRGFHRQIGVFANVTSAPDGRIITQADWDRHHSTWLPTPDDRAYIGSLMQAVTEPGKVANWIAPPAKGINGQPLEFEYVRFN
jgi:benzoyl-CoA 2,3-dioxygenase component B